MKLSHHHEVCINACTSGMTTASHFLNAWFPPDRVSPSLGEQAVSPAVQFYHDDAFLIDAVSAFIRAGYEEHATIIVVATEHPGSKERAAEYAAWKQTSPRQTAAS